MDYYQKLSDCRQAYDSLAHSRQASDLQEIVLNLHPAQVPAFCRAVTDVAHKFKSAEIVQSITFMSLLV